MIDRHAAAKTLLAVTVFAATVAAAPLIPELPPGHEVVWAVLAGALGMLATVVIGWEVFRKRVAVIAEEEIEKHVPGMLAAHVRETAEANERRDFHTDGLFSQLISGQARIEAMLVERLVAAERRFDGLEARLTERIEKVETTVIAIVLKNSKEKMGEER